MRHLRLAIFDLRAICRAHQYFVPRIDTVVSPAIPALLSGSTPSSDEIPNAADSCSGQRRGAILVDKVTCVGSGCPLLNVAYPSINRTTCPMVIFPAGRARR